jgi:tetratricopeptide (TPR) repeat protein
MQPPGSPWNYAMKDRYLSRFTPSLMAPETLEAIFVQRKGLASQIVERIWSAAEARKGEHTLLVGSRGVGKTHLVSLLYYRISKAENCRDRLAMAWLREEEWGVTCFRDFLFCILQALSAGGEVEAEFDARFEALYGLNRIAAEMAAAEMLREIGRRRSLLVLVENLDELLQQMGSEGPDKFRDFLNMNPYCSVIGTAQSGYEKFLRPHAQLKGLFHVQQLEPLTFDDAIEMLGRVAAFEGNEALAAFLETPRGRARVRALEFLAGGNHRAYVVFSRFLTCDSLEDLVEPLVRAIDDLTPYYQARMAWLPREERRIIEHLCLHRRPVRLQEIVRHCFMRTEEVLTCIDRLGHIGHVRSLSIGGESYFELSEPLMRLSIEVKRHRGTPVQLLMDFLRLWYSSTELRSRLALLPPGNDLERSYASRVLELSGDDSSEDPRIVASVKQLESGLCSGNTGQTLRAAEELVAMRGSPGDHKALARCLLQLGRREEAAQACGQISAQSPLDAASWLAQGAVALELGMPKDAAQACARALEIDPKLAAAWDLRAAAQLIQGQPREALAASEEAIRLGPDKPLHWLHHGSALAELECFADAAVAFAKMSLLAPDDPTAHIYRAGALMEARDYESALEAAERAIRAGKAVRDGWLVRGVVLAALERHPDALASLETAQELGEDSPRLHGARAISLLHGRRWREAAAALGLALGKSNTTDSSAARDAGPLIRALLPVSGLHDGGPERRDCGQSVSDGGQTVALALGVRLLVLIHRKHGALHRLGQGLVATIADLLSGEVDEEAVGLWLETWQKETCSHSEFRLPLRLLAAACLYHRTRDARALLDLPLEERRLLEPILDIHFQATA